jgi:ceramide synthetase
VAAILVSYIPTLVQGTYEYTRKRKLERPDYSHEVLEDFWIVLPCGVAIHFLKRVVTCLTSEYFKEKLAKKYAGIDLIKKTEKCCIGAFKVVYFTFTSLFGLIKVIQKTSFAPAFLLSDGELMYTLGNWPYTPMPDGMKFYYMLSFSYYVEDGIALVFQSPNYDFWEMILHHIIASMLIFSSYMSGFWIFGIFVLFCMDVEDVFIGLIRTTMDFCSVFSTMVIWSSIIFTWSWLRFYAFTKCTLWTFAMSGLVIVDNTLHTHYITNILLSTLLCLNVYWFILLLGMGLKGIFKGKAQDTQQVVTKKEIE